MRDDHAHLWLLSSVLSSNALTLFSPHPLPPTYLLTEPNRQGFISVLRLVFNWVFLKVISMDQIDMIFTAVVSLLSLVFFIFCPPKLRQIKILKIVLTVSLAKSTGPLLRRKARAFRKVHSKVLVERICDKAYLTHTSCWRLKRIWKRALSFKWHGTTCR